MKKHCLFIIFYLFFALQCIVSQSVGNESGYPFIQNYTPEDYQAFDQNWDIAEDSLGVMYFANGDGVLIYNGVEWSVVELPGKMTAFSLTESLSGQIYVGAQNEIGYLQPDSVGQIEYVSLIPFLPEEYRDFHMTRRIYATKSGMFFCNNNSIFKWDGDEFKVWLLDHNSFTHYVNDKLYYSSVEEGLMELNGDSFEPVKNGDFFRQKQILGIVSYGPNKMLLMSRSTLYVYDGNEIELFRVDYLDYFKNNTLYKIIELKNGNFAIGSLFKGLIVIDENGETQKILSEEGLLNSNQVLNLYQDRSGLLWAALFSGIAKIEYPSPFSYFNEYSNAPNTVFNFERYNGQLYIGSTTGLYTLMNGSGAKSNPEIRQVENVEGMIWGLQKSPQGLMVAANDIHLISEKGKVVIPTEMEIVKMVRSSIDTNRIFIAHTQGINSYLFKNNSWTLENLLEEITTEIIDVIESPSGDLWLELDKNAITRISFANRNDAQSLSNPRIKVFGKEDGLPNNVVVAYKIDGIVYLIADEDVFLFDSVAGVLVKDENLRLGFGLKDVKTKINGVDQNGNVWLIEYDGDERLEQLVAMKQPDGSYTLKTLKESRIINERKFDVFPELNDSVIWFKGNTGVVRHDLSKMLMAEDLKPKTIISKVLYKGDSLLYGGNGKVGTIEIVYKKNQLRFQFACTSYFDEKQNKYQYLLDGFDEDWSSWTPETQKDYTNLPEGNYEFKVRSKNIFNKIGDADTFAFSVLPPWYRSWWAYLFYGLGAFFSIALLLKWRSRELKRKNEVLEDTIIERTKEINHKNEILNRQTAELVQLNEAKTQMYTNITHEFRTPLTVILGMAETMEFNEGNGQKEDLEDSLKLIKRNGKKLLRLINELLDLAKLESGNMSLNLIQSDVIPFVKYLSESFHSLAEEKGVSFIVYSEIDNLEMDFDANKLASIVTNLISNAIKFTGSQGKVVVHLNEVTRENKSYLGIKVNDTGVGLTENEIPYIFDKFYQVNNSNSRQGQGTGIGLSIVKEFVELMGGSIEVKSKVNKRTIFSILLPITKNAVKNADAYVTIEPPITKTETLDFESLKGDETLPLALIVEDNEDVAYYLKTCLKGKYKTRHAKNGVEGIEMALENIPDILICDVMMPGKDGFEVCAALKSNELTDHIPIIMLTAKATVRDRIIGLSHGADAYLSKPFVKAELFTRLDHLIANRKKLLSKFEHVGIGDFLKKRYQDPESKFLQKIIGIIEKNISNNHLNAAFLARNLQLGESQVYRKLKAISGKSTAVFIRSIRLRKGKELLQSSDLTISEITYEVGFNDPSYFSRAFKEEFGFAPSKLSG